MYPNNYTHVKSPHQRWDSLSSIYFYSLIICFWVILRAKLHIIKIIDDNIFEGLTYRFDLYILLLFDIVFDLSTLVNALLYIRCPESHCNDCVEFELNNYCIKMIMSEDRLSA